MDSAEIGVVQNLPGRGAPRFSFPNGGYGRLQEGIKSRLHDRIALATCFLQPGAVFDLHRSTTVTDQPGMLQSTGSMRDCRAICSQHVSKKLVRIGQRFALCPVVHHEKPTAHPFFYGVKGIAGDRLHDLR